MVRGAGLVGALSLTALTGCSSADPMPQPSPSANQTAAEVSAEAGPGSGTHSSGMDARDAGHSPDPGAFGASCASGSDCESNVCFMGGKGGECSLNCTSDSECPPGADGTQHCNPRGYCRY
jgi:hypothetical protein